MILDTLRAALPEATFEATSAADMPTIVMDREHLVAACGVLRDHPALQFALLAEIAGVDFWPVEPRFEIVYHLACLGNAYATGAGPAAPAGRVRIKVRLSGADARVPTLTTIFPVANWLEREVYDLFGIDFEGHPDLRRILMPDDWTGFPLRKDYPVQIRKDTTSWEPIELTPEEFAKSVRGRSRA